jgi:uncharacterized Ntn-hydrolase superfamily protein
MAPMTWSVVARDPSGAFGVAIASKFFAVGALCPAIRSGKGALSTQALMNPLYARDGLALLDAGEPVAAVIGMLIAPDAGRESRQVHAVDAKGRTMAHTGGNCIAWCGSVSGEAFSVAGNMLAGPEVIAETARVYRESAALPFALRLITALKAGEDAGGDKRGKQSAALLVHTTEDYPALSLRVDDHAEPIDELKRLYDVSLERFQPFVSCLASRARPAGVTDRAVIEAEIARFHAAVPR